MGSYAYYRLPYTDRYTIIESERQPIILSSVEDIGKERGFCIAPFDTTTHGRRTSSNPILIIRPDRVMTREIVTQDYDDDEEYADMVLSTPDEAYHTAFEKYHDAVACGTFGKIVLARHKELETKGAMTRERHEALFIRACRIFPRLMIMLFSTPESGTWIVASPEILLKGRGEVFHTVALAGTMAYKEGYAEWSMKNKTEQNIVEQYIERTIRPLATEIIKDGPYTVRAGNLVHLRTDFRFRITTDAPHGEGGHGDCRHTGQEGTGPDDRQTTEPGAAIGKLVGRLHPTPAVCGLPKEVARDFIMANEGQERKYYSGFAGPVDINGETHLYVSLRCAELGDGTITAYAGGGIMPESTCTAEWRETEMKMYTILTSLYAD